MTATTGYVPFTEEEVERLWQRQENPNLHPYTCLYGHGPLVPTTNGWFCEAVPLCAFHQRWAHIADLGRTTP